MDIKRFFNYARYDLTINQSFYRNSAITCMLIFASISLVSFMLRWAIYDRGETIDPSGYYISWIIIMFCATAFSNIFAGCVNHPLRNKQGRISTLTLPASNSEKYCWHLLIMIVGGTLAILCSIGIADLINALFSWLVGQSPIYSYTTMCFLDLPESRLNTSLVLTGLLVGASNLSSIATFTFGNAIKWRYNIIFTILAIWIIQTIMTILSIVFVLIAPKWINAIELFISQHDFGLESVYWIAIIINLIYSAILFGLSWIRYQRVAVTNRLNK